MKKVTKKAKGSTEVVLLGEQGAELGERTVEGVGEEALAEWLRAQDPKQAPRGGWVSQVSPGTGLGAGAVTPEAPPAVDPTKMPRSKLESFLKSDMAEQLGVRYLYDVFQSVDGYFFCPTPDYPKVGVVCQRVLCAAAEVVVRAYPKGLNHLDTSSPTTAVHVLDVFFASRLGGNLEDPGRKLLRNSLVLTHELISLGTPGRCQAAACMEGVRFVVSSFLVLV